MEADRIRKGWRHLIICAKKSGVRTNVIHFESQVALVLGGVGEGLGGVGGGGRGGGGGREGGGGGGGGGNGGRKI